MLRNRAVVVCLTAAAPVGQMLMHAHICAGPEMADKLHKRCHDYIV
jgi:hypothetical protein